MPPVVFKLQGAAYSAVVFTLMVYKIVKYSIIVVS